VRLVAVIDTNVVVSAMISGEVRPPTRIIDAWHQSAFTWITSDPLIEELERAIGYPKVVRALKWDLARRLAFIDSLRAVAEVVETTSTILGARDPDDDRVLEAAVAGNAAYIVTGDKDLLALGRHERIEIVTPAAFVAVLAARPR
jgi:putative PIN family toxin of toxin-antitoxin system